jgi:hypothetical protein
MRASISNPSFAAMALVRNRNPTQLSQHFTDLSEPTDEEICMTFDEETPLNDERFESLKASFFGVFFFFFFFFFL